MRILLDENLDWRLLRDLPGHQVDSVPLIGWAGIKNGDLLNRAQSQYDVLITMDSRMCDHLDIKNLDLAVIVLRCRSNRLADTQLLMPKVLLLLPTLKPGTIDIISG